MNTLKINPTNLLINNKINKKPYSNLSANVIRQTFIDFFSNKNHSYIKSSSVKPFNDPTLEFVNAGMNQFKNVFLGYEMIPVPRAVNSQKCIRVGGKHNDLNSVGMDTYHHTFFEMLGNWSFNDYFKKEACELAWELITAKPYALDPNRLYVTYFKGDEKLNLAPDLETKEIWEGIGVAKDRILPFGLKENFWEMGPTGPCGPCTEIHYDHLGTVSRPHLVNKDSSDLTELWNNVFVQFNRLEDGSLVALDKHFVDTGMGLERLVALLQGKSSNYDTDIFLPYFSTISKISKCPAYSGKFGKDDDKGLDTAYRILSDHSRMISVAIADNVFPDESHGLRRVIRKGLHVSEKFCPGNGVSLMIELSKVAGETFSQIFPEVVNNLRQIEFVLRDENALWEEIKSKVKSDWENIIRYNPHLESLSDVQSAGLILSFNELKGRDLPPNSRLPRDLSLVLYDRYGLNPQVVEELATVCGYTVDIPQLEVDISVLKERNMASLHSSQSLNVPADTMKHILNSHRPTDDSFKTKYSKNSNGEYSFEKLSSKVQSIIAGGQCIVDLSSIEAPRTNVAVLLEQTNLWSSLKGGGDNGTIELFNNDGDRIGYIYISKVYNLRGYIYHVGQAELSIKSESIPVEGLTAEISVDQRSRTDLMRNNSAAHLLSLALRERFVCNVQSFNVSDRGFMADFLIYGHQLNDEDIKALEVRMASLISAGLDIEMTRKSTSDLVGADLTLPSYVNVNMKTLHLADIKLPSGQSFREVTTGPNVLNTKDIGSVCFMNYENKNRGRNVKISGIAGENVASAIRDAKAVISSVQDRGRDVKEKLAKLNSFMINSPIPLDLRHEFLSKLQELKREMKEKQKNERIDFIRQVILEAKRNGEHYVVKYVGKENKLERLVSQSTELPIMLFACNGDYFSAKCSVPQGSSSLRGAAWMDSVAGKLGSQRVVSKGCDSSIFMMKPIKVKKSEVKIMAKKSEDIARSEADLLLSENNVSRS